MMVVVMLVLVIMMMFMIMLMIVWMLMIFPATRVWQMIELIINIAMFFVVILLLIMVWKTAYSFDGTRMRFQIRWLTRID